MQRKSKLRLEMGEAKWEEHQKQRWRDKSRRSYHSNKDGIKTGAITYVSYISGWRLRAKLFLIEYKGGKCGMCGYDKMVPRAYDFHHRDPNEKEFNISQSTVHNLDKLKLEVDKCDLLCKNCHAEKHNDPEHVEAAMLAHDRWINSRLLEKECCFCHSTYKPKKRDQKYCKVECSNLAALDKSRKPSIEQLKDDLSTGNYSSVGIKYGVSGNAVKKWAIRLGLVNGSVAKSG